MVYEPMYTQKVPYKAYFWHAHTFGPHWHGEMEVLSCLEGEVIVRTENQEFLLSSGRTLIMAGNEPHKFEGLNDHTRLMILKFGYSLLGSEYAKIQNILLFMPNHQLPDMIRNALESLISCLRTDSILSEKNEWLIRGNLCLLAQGLKRVSSNFRRSEKQTARARRLEGIYPVLDYVKEHYRESISVEDAAALTGYAKTYFCRHFKQIIGISFHRYLNMCRINVACMLLEDPGLSVSDIAKQTGFSSPKLLCRTFKEITGLTTTQYQALPRDQRHMNWNQ